MPIVNPNFELDRARAASELRRLIETPKPPIRPVVILGGYRAPRISAWGCSKALTPMVGGRADLVRTITYPGAHSIEIAGRRVLDDLSASGLASREIDVIGISMGGLVARHLIRDHPDQFAARRLFTLATPHLGASLARLVRLDPAARAMRPGSDWLAEMNATCAESLRGCELTCYALLRDWWVGATNTAPPGRNPIWLDPVTAFGKCMAHFAINRERRILSDIARRLRGEIPLALEGAPPPIN